VVEKIKTRILYLKTFFRNPSVYEIMWRNIVESDRPQMTIWRMHIACWIPKVTNTNWEYVIIYFSFPLQQFWLERADMLRLVTILQESSFKISDQISIHRFDIMVCKEERLRLH